MRKLKTQTMKVLLFALCLVVTVIYCICSFFFVFANMPYYVLFSAGVPLLTVCLLAAWWFAMRKSWRACMVSGLLAELSLALQAAVYIWLISSFASGTVNASVALYITVAAVMLLAAALEFALVWMIQKRTYMKFRDKAFASASAVRRGWILSIVWMAVGIACAVLWMITLVIGFGREWWPLALGAIPLMLCIAAFCCAWWMSAYRGKAAGIAFTVLMVILNFLLFIAAVYMGFAINNMLTIILAFAQTIWFILYISMEVFRCIRLSRDKRKARRQNNLSESQEGRSCA